MTLAIAAVVGFAVALALAFLLAWAGSGDVQR